MKKAGFMLFFSKSFLTVLIVLLILTSTSTSMAGEAGKNMKPPPVPVKVALVEVKMVSNQISMVGTAEAIAKSIVASEVSGVVEDFPVQAGDFIKKGQSLVRLKDTEMHLRLKGYIAAREKVRADLENAEKELSRLRQLKDTNSIAERKYDGALFVRQALSQVLFQREAEIEHLEYEISQKKVFAPFSGFVAEEHTQIGEYVKPGDPVVTLVDLGQIRITVDVPERYVVMLPQRGKVSVLIKSFSSEPFPGNIYAVLPQGDPDSRTFPVRINLENPNFKIKSGMEATVTFNLTGNKSALLVPKDAVVTAGNNRLVFSVVSGKAIPVNVNIFGYYDGNVAIDGNLKPGDRVVVRGNERLRPGQSVTIIK